MPMPTIRKVLPRPLEAFAGPVLDKWYNWRIRKMLLKQAHETEMFRAMMKQLDPSEATQLVDTKKRINPPIADATYQELEQTYSVGVWVYRAINAIAENAVQAPLIVKNLENERIDSPLPRKPNSVFTWNRFRQLTHIWLELTGNAFIWWDRENGQFWGLRPSRMRIVPGPDGRSVIGYAYRLSGFDEKAPRGSLLTQTRFATTRHREPLYASQKEFDSQIAKWAGWLNSGHHFEEKLFAGTEREWMPLQAEDVIHIFYPDPSSDFYGMSPLKPLLVSFISEMHARQWNRRFFENGAIPPGILSFPRVLPRGEFRRLTEQFKERHDNNKNAWMPFFTQAGAEFKPFENSHTDLDFMNLIKMSRDETLSIFNVPPVVVGVYEGLTGSTRSVGTREQRRSFWDDTLIPKLMMIAEDWTMKLDELLPEGFFFAFDTDDVEALQPNWNELTEAAESAIGSGLSPQEVRRLIYGVTEVPNEPIFLPANLQPVDLTNPQIIEDWYFNNPSGFHQARPIRIARSLPLPPPASPDRSHMNTRRQHRREKQAKQNAEDEEGRAAEWKSVVKQFEATEDELVDWLVPLFEGQEERFLNLVLASHRKAPSDIESDVIAQGSEEFRIFRESAIVEFTDQIELAGEFGLDQANIEAAFDVLNPNVVMFVDEKAIRFADRVTETTIDQLRTQIRQWLRQGENIVDLTKRVQTVFNGTVRGTKPRARLIARTESTGIVSGGQRLAFEQHQDIVPQMEWRASRDDRVRPTHTAADGQIIQQGQTFTVGGASLRFPGDPQAPVREIANCRCVLLPVVDEDALLAFEPELVTGRNVEPYPEDGFETIEEIEGWADQRWPEMVVDFLDGNPTVFNEVIRTLDSLHKDFPFLEGNIEYFGTYTTPSKFPTGAPGRFSSDKTEGHASRFTATQKAFIAFNRVLYGENADVVKSTRQRQKKEGWLVNHKDSGDLYGLMVHEFGHVIDSALRGESGLNQLKLGLGSVRLDASLENRKIGNLHELHRLFLQNPKNEATIKTSVYATLDDREQWAEGFTGAWIGMEDSTPRYISRIRKYMKFLIDNKESIKPNSELTDWQDASISQRREALDLWNRALEAVGSDKIEIDVTDDFGGELTFEMLIPE